jgi:hypothetical protein
MSTNPPEPQGQPTPPPAYSPPADSAPSGYPAANYAPPVGEPAPKTKGPAGLGIIAFAASVAGIVIGSILAFMGGLQTGGLGQYAEVSSGSGTVDGNSLPPEGQQMLITAGILTFSAFAVWGVLALWGLIQGIIAAVKNRGRGWGIAAIVLAVIGIGAVVTFYGIGLAAGVAPYAS